MLRNKLFSRKPKRVKKKFPLKWVFCEKIGIVSFDEYFSEMDTLSKQVNVLKQGVNMFASSQDRFNRVVAKHLGIDPNSFKSDVKGLDDRGGMFG